MIVFSGLDGAGKSTQIDLLQKDFVENGKKVYLFWSRGGYSPGMELLKGILRKGKSGMIPKSRGHSKERDSAFSNSLVVGIWMNLAILDLIFFYGFYLRWKRLLGYEVICDRYMEDTEIDFKLNFPEYNLQKKMLWKLLGWVKAKPQHHFVLVIPVEVSMHRSVQKGEPFPDSKEVLEFRLQEYIRISETKKAVHLLWCTSGISEVKSEIQEKVFW